MTCFLMLRRIWHPAKRILTGSIPLLFVMCLGAADVKRVSQEEAMRAIASKTKPEYSAMARQLRLTGSVGVEVVIAEDGKVETVTVVNGNPILAKMATDSLKQWTFTPFKADGKAIKVVSQFVLTFNL